MLSILSVVPAWVGIVILVAAIVVHWQLKEQKKAEAKAEAKNNLDALYSRYASELTQDPKQDQVILEAKIANIHANEPDMSESFADVFDRYIILWEQHFKEPMPSYISYAILRDFEYIQQFLGMKNTLAVATARALIDRFDDFDRWLEITGTPITDEEIETAERALEADYQKDLKG